MLRSREKNVDVSYSHTTDEGVRLDVIHLRSKKDTDDVRSAVTRWPVSGHLSNFCVAFTQFFVVCPRLLGS